MTRWTERYRENAERRRLALRAEGRLSTPELAEAIADEVTERINVPSRHRSDPAPARAIRSILSEVTDWRKVVALALILGALVALAVFGVIR